jgi:hypothetical protein
MLAKLHVKSLIAASGLALATGMSGPANAADPFTLTSATFKDGTLMPKKVANKKPQNPNCVGDSGNEHAGSRLLLGPLHTAWLAASLHVRGDSDRPRCERAVSRSDAAGTAGQARGEERAPMSVIAAICGQSRFALHDVVWTGQVSEDMAELLSPIARAHEADKLRFRRNDGYGDGANRWETSSDRGCTAVRRRALTKRFNGVAAVDDLSLTVARGEVLGPNGRYVVALGCLTATVDPGFTRGPAKVENDELHCGFTNKPTRPAAPLVWPTTCRRRDQAQEANDVARRENQRRSNGTRKTRGPSTMTNAMHCAVPPSASARKADEAVFKKPL